MSSGIAKILIADDNPNYLADILPSFGYEVVVAHDGLQALQILTNKDNDVDLLILDVMMPHLDGFETLKIIRSKEHLENLPIIMLTAVDSEQKQISGLKFGADDYIVKPFSLPNLLARIEAILRRVKIAQKTIANKTKSVNIHVSNENPIVPLTQREKEILSCVAQGDNNATISEKLFVREVTVKTHLNKIFKKLNVTNRTQAVLVAMQMNILQ